MSFAVCVFKVSPPSTLFKSLSHLEEESCRGISLGFVYDYLALAPENGRNVKFISAWVWGLSSADVFLSLENRSQGHMDVNVHIVSMFLSKAYYKDNFILIHIIQR